MSLENGQYCSVIGIGRFINKESSLGRSKCSSPEARPILSVFFTSKEKKLFKQGELDMFILRVGNFYVLDQKSAHTNAEIVSANICSVIELHGRLGPSGIEKTKQFARMDHEKFNERTDKCDACHKGKIKQGPCRHGHNKDQEAA